MIDKNTPVVATLLFTITSREWVTPLPSTKSGIKHPEKRETVVTSSADKKAFNWDFIIPLSLKYFENTGSVDSFL